jgi:quinol monooxygenase YgiN
MAYVIIVEFRAKPDRIQAFAELIDRHAHNSRTLEDGCLAFDVCQDPDDPARFVFYEAYRDQAAHRQHLEMDSFKWFRATAPGPYRARLRKRPAPPSPGADPPPLPFRVA